MSGRATTMSVSGASRTVPDEYAQGIARAVPDQGERIFFIGSRPAPKSLEPGDPADRLPVR